MGFEIASDWCKLPNDLRREAKWMFFLSGSLATDGLMECGASDVALLHCYADSRLDCGSERASEPPPEARVYWKSGERNWENRRHDFLHWQRLRLVVGLSLDERCDGDADAVRGPKALTPTPTPTTTGDWQQIRKASCLYYDKLTVGIMLCYDALHEIHSNTTKATKDEHDTESNTSLYPNAYTCDVNAWTW